MFPRFYIDQSPVWADDYIQRRSIAIADRSGIFDPLPCPDRVMADFVVEALNRNHERIVAERKYAQENAPLAA